MSEAERDTIPPGPETPSDPPNLHELTERELLLLMHERLDVIERRLEEGERRFARSDADWTIAMRFLQSVNTFLGQREQADAIESEIMQRRGANGDAHGAPGGG